MAWLLSQLMSSVSNRPNTPLENFPSWARQLSESYYSGAFSLFVTHGNVRDLVPVRQGESIELFPLQRFLHEALFGQRDLILSYDRGGGLAFAHPEMQADFQRALAG